MPPAASIRRCGVVCNSLHAASSALYSILFLSGLNSNCNASGFIASGKRFGFQFFDILRLDQRLLFLLFDAGQALL